MPDLNPITREETLLDGGDLTPITRKEMFIKRIYDKTQSVPEPITREEYFLKKAGEASGDVTIEQLNVTRNGTYSESGKAYSPVVVNVPIPENAYLLNDLSGLPADIASFTDGTDLPMASLKVAVTPYQDLSHGDPSPKNICPIIGWTACNVVRTGKNLVYKTISKATISSNGKFVIASSLNTDMQIAQVKKDKVYTITSDELFVGGFFTSEPTNGSVTYNNSRWADTPKTFTSPIDGYVAFRTSNGYATPQMELGSSATTYEEYNGHTYTIDLDGTRYGGKLDVVSGVLTLTHGFISSYNGETLPSTWISDRDVYAEGTTPTIGAEVVYELATPQTYQLTPTQVKSLLGQNNIWADTGKILEAEYFTKGE